MTVMHKMSDYDYIRERSLSLKGRRQIYFGLSAFDNFDYSKKMINYAIRYSGGLVTYTWSNLDVDVKRTLHDFSIVNRYLGIFKYGIRYRPRKRPKKNS